MNEPTPILRFAPSPNGALHLGHAYSALVNQHMAQALGGHWLLRFEDIDTARCTLRFEADMIEDLRWLGLEWQGEPRRQSQHLDTYREALDSLKSMGLVYPAFLSRSEIKAIVSHQPDWPRDPDGQPHYPGDERSWSDKRISAALEEERRHAWRLNMQAALERVDGPLTWRETGYDGEADTAIIEADPSRWGDVILARSDTPTSYHLSVVIDDAIQGITHVVRGEDLYEATAIHRLLQQLLDLPEPLYHHHRLIRDEQGRKLSKSSHDTSLQALRASGYGAAHIRAKLDLGPYQKSL
ncbi:MAG: tRNA glutamyl-Q(34) synthetase GluQRS [Ahrensia sp.]|nr:tRNA glutamyl-Q(34) synthetase GluQRS [Ahrensia sp.]